MVYVSPAFKPIFDFLLLIIVILVIHFYFIFYGFQYPPGIFNLLYYFCAYVKHKVYVWWYHTCFWVICELRYSFYIFIMLFKKHRRIYNCVCMWPINHNTFTIWLFGFSHPRGCEVISHCGFDLHFPDG